MPLLSTSGATAAKGFGMFIDPMAKYFFGGVSIGGGYGGIAHSVTTINNNVYVSGVSGQNQIIAYDSVGNLLWHKNKSCVSNSNSGIVADSSGNLYVTTTIYDGTRYYAHLAKLDSSGSSVWQVRFGTTSDNTYVANICRTPTGVVIVGDTVDSSRRAFIASYDTSGTLLWQRGFVLSQGGTYNSAYFSGATADSSGNVYAVGAVSVTAGGRRVLYVKYDSSGAIQWQYVMGGGGYISTGVGIARSSSGEIYISGYGNYRAGGSVDFCIWRLNSSGTVTFSGAALGTNMLGSGIVIDSQDNVYVSGFDNNTNGKIILAKLNSNLSWQWINTVARSPINTDSYAYGICLDAKTNLCFTGHQSTDSSSNTWRYMFFGRVPSDASKTGTYTLSSISEVYTNSSFSYNQYSIAEPTTANLGTDYSLGYTSSAYTISLSNGTQTIATKIL